jgi:hypothetical protein
MDEYGGEQEKGDFKHSRFSVLGSDIIDSGNAVHNLGNSSIICILHGT